MHAIRVSSWAALLVITLLSSGSSAPSAERDALPVDRLDDRAEVWAGRYDVETRLARLILDEARAAGVAPGIAFGLIAVESDFDSSAVGREGERGLMQVKPSTAREYERGITAEGLARPAANLRIGLAHLKRQIDHFGDPGLGLLAYNMGRARLSRILAAGARPGVSYAARVLARCEEACA